MRDGDRWEGSAGNRTWALKVGSRASNKMQRVSKERWDSSGDMVGGKNITVTWTGPRPFALGGGTAEQALT